MYQKEMAAKSLFRNSGLETAFSKEVQRAFLQSFGIGTDTKAYGSVCYDYDNGSSMIITFEPGAEGKCIKVTFDEEMKRKLKALEQKFDTDVRKNTEEIRKFIYNDIFALDMDVVYIPAGRSISER